MEKNELSKNAMGGTEQMLKRLHDSIGPELLSKFQIIPSRVRELDQSKKRILWLHDLPEDPESARLNETWFREQFDAIVCVSDWQLQRYNLFKSLPYKDAVVLQNAIEPIPVLQQDKHAEDTVRFIYHTTPHRGLEILVPVFIELAKKYPNIHLDVYSSFNIYGWPERDKQFEDLFEKCRQHPQITYHGSVSNEEVRDALMKAHIFAYPNTWLETSCIALIEAMSAGLMCVHPNHGALPETAGGLTRMYQYNEDVNLHAQTFYNYLNLLLENKVHENYEFALGFQKPVTDYRFDWDRRQHGWQHLLESVQAQEKQP